MDTKLKWTRNPSRHPLIKSLLDSNRDYVCETLGAADEDAIGMFDDREELIDSEFAQRSHKLA